MPDLTPLFLARGKFTAVSLCKKPRLREEAGAQSNPTADIIHCSPTLGHPGFSLAATRDFFAGKQTRSLSRSYFHQCLTLCIHTIGLVLPRPINWQFVIVRNTLIFTINLYQIILRCPHRLGTLDYIIRLKVKLGINHYCTEKKNKRN